MVAASGLGGLGAATAVATRLLFIVVDFVGALIGGTMISRHQRRRRGRGPAARRGHGHRPGRGGPAGGLMPHAGPRSARRPERRARMRASRTSDAARRVGAVGTRRCGARWGRYPPVVVQAGTALVARDAELAELDGVLGDGCFGNRHRRGRERRGRRGQDEARHRAGALGAAPTASCCAARPYRSLPTPSASHPSCSCSTPARRSARRRRRAPAARPVRALDRLGDRRVRRRTRRPHRPPAGAGHRRGPALDDAGLVRGAVRPRSPGRRAAGDARHDLSQRRPRADPPRRAGWSPSWPAPGWPGRSRSPGSAWPRWPTRSRR